MQAFIYQKTFSDTPDQLLWNWNGQTLEQLNAEFYQKGRVIILQKSSFDNLETFFRTNDHINCKIKEDSKELYRSLNLHWKKERNSLRRIIANYKKISDFKKSFSQFLKRYSSDDPTCIIFIPEEIFKDLIQNYGKKPVVTAGFDPINSLVTMVSDEPAVRELRDIFLGESPEVQLTRALIYKASLSKSPVLILGESGTGKEIIANQIYIYSKYNRKELFTINCSNIPETLLETELFGHKKGTFTDASEHREGLFAAANGGTIFLDEIGDLSLQNQIKILRAIESNEIKALGENKSIKIDVRIIAATNRNLASMIKQKTFREDLYYRLNTFTIIAAPLREHPEDIPIIAEEMWSKLNTSKKLSQKFLDYLMEYHWPGNVRELKTMLNSIFDLFGDISPEPGHIEAIRNLRKEVLMQSQLPGEDEFTKMLKAECKTRIIEVQNIMRGIKIEVRPLIHSKLKYDEKKSLNNFKKFVSKEIEKLEDLCREPIFFKDKVLFDRIKRFRYLLEKKIRNMPESMEELNQFWRNDMEALYDAIDKEIFEMIWGKVEL